jgi:hypothetical protein
MRILIGIAIGLYIGYKVWHEDPSSNSQEEARQEEPAPKRKPLALQFRPQKTLTIPNENLMAPPVAKAIRKAEGRLITLTSHTIAEMENNWHDLGQDIHLAREADGWRITELGNNSLFAKAGFAKGDLITEKAIAMLRDTEQGQDNLPERFQQILRSVTN